MVTGIDFYNRRKGFEFKKPSAPAGLKVEHRIGVHAPPNVVWDIIHDVAAWPQWNPIYPAAGGVVRIGERLRLTRALPGRPAEDIQPLVLDWTPNELLHTRLTSLGGLVSVTQYWEIDTLAEENCIFSTGELYMGWFGPSALRRVARSLRQGVQTAAEALKVRAEAAWRDQAAAPTSEP